MAIATAFEVSLYAMLSSGRTERVSRARWAAIKIMRDYLCMSSPRIGAAMGRRHPTSIQYGLEGANWLYITGTDWRRRYDDALASLGKRVA